MQVFSIVERQKEKVRDYTSKDTDVSGECTRAYCPLFLAKAFCPIQLHIYHFKILTSSYTKLVFHTKRSKEFNYVYANMQCIYSMDDDTLKNLNLMIPPLLYGPKRQHRCSFIKNKRCFDSTKLVTRMVEKREHCLICTVVENYYYVGS